MRCCLGTIETKYSRDVVQNTLPIWLFMRGALSFPTIIYGRNLGNIIIFSRAIFRRCFSIVLEEKDGNFLYSIIKTETVISGGNRLYY